MGEEGGERTEEPTPHRLREAREKGQVAKSREITTAVLLLLSYFLFRYMGAFMWQQLFDMAAGIFAQIPYVANEFSLSFVAYLLVMGLRAMAFTLAPIFAVTFVAALVAEAMQTGFVMSADPLAPKLERLSPLSGLKKMFSLQGLVETFKSILKILIVFYIGWIVIRDDLPYVIVLMDGQPFDALVLGGSMAYTVAMRVGIFYLVVAVLDYLYRRWEYMRGLKMTRQEVKEEYKRLEGDPQVKQRMRDMQRQVAQQRMMAAVPQADVVVTNPTHIAVALKYDQARMKAPLLLAKGERLIAQDIRRIAEEHYVPVVENEPLARSIYRTTKLNREVPRQLYQAVAEVLAYVYKKKKEREARRQPPQTKP
ncbi:MAG: flagellar biosynthesis protein FlhB [Candidatus Margulisiibacteriota bacterium]